jgi:hypothetical protein
MTRPDTYQSSVSKSKAVKKKAYKPATATKRDDFNLSREAGKIAFNVIVSRRISYSLEALLGGVSEKTICLES